MNLDKLLIDSYRAESKVIRKYQNKYVCWPLLCQFILKATTRHETNSLEAYSLFGNSIEQNLFESILRFEDPPLLENIIIAYNEFVVTKSGDTIVLTC